MAALLPAVLRRSPYLLAFVVFAACVAMGLVAHAVASSGTPRKEVAGALQRAGRTHEAEALYWSVLQEEPTLEVLVPFLDAHLLASAGPRMDGAGEDDDAPPLPLRSSPGPAVSEQAIDAFLAREDLAPAVRLLGRFWREAPRGGVGDELRAAVEAAAAAEPPEPWANRLLAREAEARGRRDEAVERLLREGRAVPGHGGDVAHALTLLIAAGAWDDVHRALADPAVAAQASPTLKARAAIERSAYGEALRWLLPAAYERPEPGALALAAVAALAWAVFCARLGKVGERPVFRLALYTTAFALGTFSVVVTDGLVLLEESKLRLVETGDPARDLLYFVFGVGLREEASKLLLFLPLLPVVRRYGAHLDVLVSAAFVGLGFAAMENVLYLSRGALTAGLERFVTANFLHMAMTAVLARGVDELADRGDAYAPELSRTALLVVGLHGAYDFLLSHPSFGGSYFAMALLFIMAAPFLSAVDHARGRTAGDESLLRTFVVGVSAVAGATFLWACILAGPKAAALASAESLLGTVLLIYAFAQRFRTL